MFYQVALKGLPALQDDLSSLIRHSATGIERSHRFKFRISLKHNSALCVSLICEVCSNKLLQPSNCCINLTSLQKTLYRRRHGCQIILIHSPVQSQIGRTCKKKEPINNNKPNPDQSEPPQLTHHTIQSKVGDISEES